MSMGKWSILIGLFVIILVGVTILIALPPRAEAPTTTEPSTFAECAALYPVMESYPRQCNTPSGKHFMEDIGNELEKTDLIRLESPRPGTAVSSPLVVKGQARGYWFFEASFPVILTDWDGRIIAEVPAQARGDWMTEEFVPFEATLEFETPAAGDPAVNRGSLILKKDNPSGLPEYDDALEIPIVFK